MFIDVSVYAIEARDGKTARWISGRMSDELQFVDLRDVWSLTFSPKGICPRQPSVAVLGNPGNDGEEFANPNGVAAAL